MRFGKFLTERDVVSAAAVLSALGEQSRRRAFLPLMLAEAGFVSAEFALQCTESYLRNDEELLVDSFRRGLLSARDYQNLEREWRASSPPLGEILVERGLLTRLQLNACLKAFQSLGSRGNLKVVSMRA